MTQLAQAPIPAAAAPASPFAGEIRAPGWRNLACAGLWIAGAALVATALVPTGKAEPILLLAGVLGLPIALRWALGAQARQQDRLRRINPASRLHRWLAGSFLRKLLCLAGATTATGWLLIQMWLQPALIGWAAAALPAVWLAHRWPGRPVARRIAEPWKSAAATRTAIWTATAALLLLAMVGTWLLPPEQGPATLADAQSGLPQTDTEDRLMGTVLTAARFMAALAAYAVGAGQRLDPDVGLGLRLLATLHQAGLFWLIATALSAFLLDRRDLLQALQPLKAEPGATRPLLRHLSLPLAIMLLAILLVPQALRTEVRNREVDSGLRLAISYVERSVERIDGADYEPGTVAQLETLKGSGVKAVEAARATAHAATKRTFQAMRANVDPYLDWHYSLGGEVGRLFASEEKLAQSLANRLNEGIDFAAVDQSIAGLNQAAGYAKAMQEAQQQLLSARRVVLQPNERPVIVNEAASASLFLKPVTPPDPVSFKARLRASAVVGGLAGGGAALLIGRAVSARASGSAVGAAFGSAVPVVGTVAGLAAGAAVGVAVDVALLKANEAANRPAVRQAIIAAIDQAERNALAAIG